MFWPLYAIHWLRVLWPLGKHGMLGPNLIAVSSNHGRDRFHVSDPQ